MAGSGSGSLLGWSNRGGRHIQGPHWSPSDCPSTVGGGEGGGGGGGRPGATRVSSRRQRGREIGVRVEGGTTRWDGSILQTSLPSEAFPSHACVITPHPAPPYSPPPPPPPHESSRNTWYLQVERHRGAFCNDRTPGPEGPLRVTSIQLWPPTSIKEPVTQRVIICFAEKELFIHGKANCST